MPINALDPAHLLALLPALTTFAHHADCQHLAGTPREFAFPGTLASFILHSFLFLSLSTLSKALLPQQGRLILLTSQCLTQTWTQSYTSQGGSRIESCVPQWVRGRILPFSTLGSRAPLFNRTSCGDGNSIYLQ